MSNIEKIRKEIERRKKVYLTKNGFPKGTFGAIKIETYEGLLAFIDSLPEEFPPYCTGAKGDPDPAGTSDLEEAAKRRKMGITPIGIIRMKVQELKWADVNKAGDLDIHPLEKDKYDYSIKQCDKIIAFIDNLPLTIAKESPVLNEAADDYQTTFNKTIGPFYHDDQKRAFIAGAKWQKEHKPAEWSEEEKAIIHGCINRIYVPDKYIDHSNDARSIAFLESLLNGLRIKGIKGPSCDPGRRGRMGGVPKEISKEAEAFQAQFPAPYDKDDIITAYETAKIESMKDLPKWKEAKTCGKRECFVGSSFEATGRRYPVLFCYGYGISIEQLFEKLPKEDK